MFRYTIIYAHQIPENFGGGDNPLLRPSGRRGMDIFSAEDAIIKAGERKNIRTGLKVELPEGFVGLVWDKSGLALKNGIKTMAGVIDPCYRGEIGIVLVNLSGQDYKIEKGKKSPRCLSKN